MSKTLKWIPKLHDDGSFCYLYKTATGWIECGFQIAPWNKEKGIQTMYVKIDKVYLKNKLLHEPIDDIKCTEAHKYLQEVAGVVLQMHYEREEKKKE